MERYGGVGDKRIQRITILNLRQNCAAHDHCINVRPPNITIKDRRQARPNIFGGRGIRISGAK